MQNIEAIVDSLAGKADDVVLDRISTLARTSGEYKDPLAPDFDDAIEEVDVDDAVGKFFQAEKLRFGDIHLPKTISERMRYLIAVNLAKEAAKKLAIRSTNDPQSPNFSVTVYPALTKKLTDQLLGRQSSR